MAEPFSSYWHELTARPDGPLAFRFYLQPLMACAFAIRDGLKDARTGRPAYFWGLFSDRPHTREMIRDGWRSIRRVFLFAIAMDVVYQLLVLKGLRPLESLVIATLLALVPYVLVRGPVNRIARRIRHRPAGPAAPTGHAA
jgi:hypothetical protein